MRYKVTSSIIHKVTYISRKMCKNSVFPGWKGTGRICVGDGGCKKPSMRKENLPEFYSRRLRGASPSDKMNLSTWEVFLWRQN